MKKKNRSNQERLLDLMKLTHRFQNVPRMVRKTGRLAWENNAEHTEQLGTVCLYLIDLLDLDLDRYKVIMYAKVHDWPEVFNDETGDHCELTDKAEILRNKPAEEHEAMERLKKLLQEFKTFHTFLESYENKVDKESVFVYSIDKLVSFWNIVLDNGLTWKQFNTQLDEIIRVKEHKIRLCPIGSRLFDDLLVLLRSKNGELFPREDGTLPFDQIVPMPASRLHRLRTEKLSKNLVVLNGQAAIPA